MSTSPANAASGRRAHHLGEGLAGGRAYDLAELPAVHRPPVQDPGAPGQRPVGSEHPPGRRLRAERRCLRRGRLR